MDVISLKAVTTKTTAVLALLAHVPKDAALARVPRFWAVARIAVFKCPVRKNPVKDKKTKCDR
jgi:hypothetical protein